MGLDTSMHEPHVSSNIQRECDQYRWKNVLNIFTVMFAIEFMRQNDGPKKESPTIPSQTLIENCCWCLD
jgi:hypothetical protein